MKMYFLGQAGNYRAADIWRHTFAVGTIHDSSNLVTYLSRHFNVARSKVVLYSTGRTALAAGIKTLLPKGSEVIVNSLTCYAVVEAVTATGCKPVYADVDPKTLHFDEQTLKAALQRHPKAKAIIVQNNLGIPVDMAKIECVARKHHLRIIEDLAHCAGVTYPDGRKVGSVGDIVALSFGKGKSVDTISGGALIVRNPDLTVPFQPVQRQPCTNNFRARFYPFYGAKIRGLYHFSIKGKNLGRAYTALLLKLHLIERSADANLNVNWRLTHWQAKLALHHLRALPANRPPLREFYLVERRAYVLNQLYLHGFVCYDTWYDCPVAPARYYDKVKFPEAECPVAVELAQQLINLPTWYGKAAMQPARKLIEKYDVTKKLAHSPARSTKTKRTKKGKR